MQLIRTLLTIAAASTIAPSALAQAQDAPKPNAYDPYAYGSPPSQSIQFAPSAGAEFGFGAVIPSLHVPALQLQGRLGISVRTPSDFAIVIAGQTGLTAAFNAGGQSSYYGYLLRVPLEAVVEGIWSHLVSYENRRFLNVHGGVLGGTGAVLSAQCQGDACNYVQPSLAPAFGLRAGLSFSASTRSSLGVFVTWRADFPKCDPYATQCGYLSTMMATLGWTLF